MTACVAAFLLAIVVCASARDNTRTTKSLMDFISPDYSGTTKQYQTTTTTERSTESTTTQKIKSTQQATTTNKNYQESSSRWTKSEQSSNKNYKGLRTTTSFLLPEDIAQKVESYAGSFDYNYAVNNESNTGHGNWSMEFDKTDGSGWFSMSLTSEYGFRGKLRMNKEETNKQGVTSGNGSFQAEGMHSDGTLSYTKKGSEFIMQAKYSDKTVRFTAKGDLKLRS